MILHIPAVLSEQQVTLMRTQLEAADWVDGRASVGAQGAKVKRNRQLSEHSPLARELGDIIQAALLNNPLYFAAALPLRSVPPLFNGYAGGEHYGAHIDGSVRIVAGSPLPVRTDISATLFLNAPDSYDGGELIVSDTYGSHEIKLPAGDLILYPSTSLHRVEPVSRGERLCSFFWIQSMIQDDGKRGMLFELDQHIQKLRARVGDCEEVIGLTGHYHNLIRMWAQI
ncbi:Fe2+-dependent dioxygenase [Glaciimonas sp. PCH181]|uniref:Fe2+-dependent dioxygenase n=1 Tax=Glaciimonas sp. PCH181 TaxID=2133943 RepID=UPI000D3A75FA|nr:Fe2+-dependent dioxygenase [Glaciimonas sp. PCH181]PUA19836.1 Fe2+-dependent dioxygenase [Glaciimonas sp. PCH181]